MSRWDKVFLALWFALLVADGIVEAIAFHRGEYAKAAVFSVWFLLAAWNIQRLLDKETAR